MMLINEFLGKRRIALNLWIAFGGLVAICWLVGSFNDQNIFTNIKGLTEFLGFPEGFQMAFESTQLWLVERSEPVSAVTGVIIGLAIFALLIYSVTGVMLSGPAAPTLVVAVAVTQQVGQTQLWWLFVIGIPILFGGIWRTQTDAKDREGYKVLGIRMAMAGFEVALLLVALPLLVFNAFCAPRRERASAGAEPSSGVEDTLTELK